MAGPSPAKLQISREGQTAPPPHATIIYQLIRMHPYQLTPGIVGDNNNIHFQSTAGLTNKQMQRPEQIETS